MITSCLIAHFFPSVFFFYLMQRKTTSWIKSRFLRQLADHLALQANTKSSHTTSESCPTHNTVLNRQKEKHHFTTQTDSHQPIKCANTFHLHTHLFSSPHQLLFVICFSSFLFSSSSFSRTRTSFPLASSFFSLDVSFFLRFTLRSFLRR